jgi:hypothetical protein
MRQTVLVIGFFCERGKGLHKVLIINQTKKAA